MPRSNHIVAFLESEDGQWFKRELEQMAKSKQYDTASRYTTTKPDVMTFVDTHVEYVCRYSYINHHQYISNLKLRTKNR